MAEAMPVTPPAYHADVERCVDAVLAEIGNEIVLALPLGLGKAYQFANALYRRATRDSSLKFTILTALTLEKPTPSGELEQRLTGPIVQRRFGGCPELAYAADRRRSALPPNIKVHEFFFQTGAQLSSPGAQQDYISTNYTQAVRDLLDHGVNVLGQLVARRTRDGRTRFSLSCNPDVTLDLLPEFKRLRRAGVPIALVAEVNRNLPFMPGDAEVDPAVFDHVVENEATHYQLFTLPSRPVSSADHVAGLHVASLIRDGGTLQLGIGSIGDAVTYALKLRHQQNARFQDLMSALAPPEARSPALFEAGEFEQGLYAASEMFVEGFLELWRAGILRRKVYGDARLQALLNAGRIDEPVTEETLSALRDAEAIGPRLRADDVDFLKRFGVFREGVVWRDGELLAEDGTKVPGDLGDPEACARIAETCLGTELKRGVLLHGAFFLGTRGFYRALNGFSDEEHALFAMTAVA